MSYSPRGGYGYGSGRRGGSSHFWNRKKQQRETLTPKELDNANNLNLDETFPEEPAFADPQESQPLTIKQETYLILIEGKQSWTSNAWSAKLGPDLVEQSRALILLSNKQKVIVIMADPKTNEPIQSFQVIKVAELQKLLETDPEQQTIQNRPILSSKLSELKNTLEALGYTLRDMDGRNQH